ncbi:MAG: VOC family protein, partial [Acidimicrobiales bacterium]
TLVDESAHAGEAQVAGSPQRFYGGVIYTMASGALLGLRPVAPSGQRFDSEQTGLDHLSFAVASREDLLAARQKLDEAGIPHGEVTDLGVIAILSFEDPDGVHLELTAPLS